MEKIVDGSVYRWCGCRGAVTGRQLNGRCELLDDRARKAFLAVPDAVAAGRAWTVRRWLEQWLDTRTDHVRASTLRGYREHVRHYLIPLLGHLRLASVKTAHVQAAFRVIVAGKTRSGRLLASSTLDRIRATLRSALAEAMRQWLIEMNPAARVRLPKPYPPGGVDTDSRAGLAGHR